MRYLTAIATVIVLALLSMPALACDTPPKTFTNGGPSDMFYIQAYDGVNVMTLDTGESYSFWVGAPGADWAVWTSTTDDWDTAQPIDLVDSGTFCMPEESPDQTTQTVVSSPVGPGIEDDTDMVVSPILPLGVHPI